MELIEKFLKEQIGITDPYITNAVLSTSSIHTLKKGERLIEQGQAPVGLCFLLNGVLRGFFINYNGQDVTDCFGYQFGTIAMPYADMMRPSPICIEALADSTILVIPTQTMLDIITNSIEAVHVYNRMLLTGAAEHWEIKTAMYQYSASERYAWFNQRYPGLLDLVPHKHIASFLGMSPVTLSRLRGKLKAQK